MSAHVNASMFDSQPDLSRRRGQRRGYLYQKGPSWLLRWREDVIDSQTGKITRIQFSRALAPADGPGKLTRKEAERFAWDEILSKLDQATIYPQTLCTLEQFITQKFLPDWTWSLKPAGQKHYQSQTKVVIRHLGKMRLRDVQTPHIQHAAQQLIENGKSTQSARHFKNAVSAIFRHAQTIGWYEKQNPAAAVRLPRMVRKPLHALTVDQAQALLAVLRPQVRTMAVLSMCCSLNVAELAGLQWKHLNLEMSYQVVDGESLPPHTLAVRRNVYEGQVTSTKTGGRLRNVPLPSELVSILSELRDTSKFSAAEDPVFSTSVGTPIDRKNLHQRELIPAGRRIGLSWRLGWHVFRHTAATLMEHVGMLLSDRQSMLGHSSPAMTMHYTHSDLDRRRMSIEAISSLLVQSGTQLCKIDDASSTRRENEKKSSIL